MFYATYWTCANFERAVICSSLFDSFSVEQKAALEEFTRAAYAAKLIDGIYELIITRQVFVRFLAAADFNI